MNKLTVLDLFSGIGGFSLGLERTGGFKTVAFCEIDNYCQRVLRKHWPDTYIHSDIRTLGAQHFEHYRKPDVIVGGFPCQDISVAGKGVGLSGERSGLWFEMLRVIRELRPTWLLIENVAKLRDNGADTVLGGLEEEGYTPVPVNLGAWTVGCKHNRNRTWILCHANGGDAARVELGRESILSAQEWSLAQAEQSWRKRLDELVPRDRCEGMDSYSRAVRAANGIPRRLDRLRALGNSVVPQIPELFGRFILSMEAAA